MFGTGGSSQFTFGGTATPNPFGTATATAAPSATGSLFGSSAAPAPALTLNSTFTFGTPAATAPAAAPAASQPLTFGTGLASSSAIRPFGSTFSFGTAPAASTATTSTTSTPFGSTSLFGASQPAAAQPSTSIFGTTSSAFGAASATQPASMFGATTMTNQIGTTVKFDPVPGQDTMRTKNNTFTTINTKLQCISAMKEYLNKSMEELRMEDYQANRKFPPATSLFGTMPATGMFNPSPFATSTTFGGAPATSTAPSIFGNTGTTTANPFGTAAPAATTATGGIFNRSFSAAPATSTPAFTFGASAAPTTSIFGTTTTTTASPFGVQTSAAPATTSIFGATQPTTSIFGSTTTASPFGVKPATTQPAFGFGTTTSTASPFTFAPQQTTSSIFSQPTTNTPFGTVAPTTTTSMFGGPASTATIAPTVSNPFGTAVNPFGTATSTAAPVFGAATNTSPFPAFGATAPGATTGFFGAPATSTATTGPMFSGFNTQPGAAAPGQFSFSTATSTAPTMFGSTAPAGGTSFMFNPQPSLGFGMTAPAPTTQQAFSFAPFGAPSTTSGLGSTMGTLQPQPQTQNLQPMISLVQQRFLAASLLDPFASRGMKDFSTINQVKPPSDLIVVSSLSTTSTTTVTSSSTIPLTLPLQSNARKPSSARPLVDIRFKLKPVSSSPTTPDHHKNVDETQSPNHPTTTTSIGPIKSPLMADFSEEEEQVLIGRNKMSKLRLSNDFIDSSFQSESIRSLYPLRRLAELEALANINNNTNTISAGPPAFSSTSSTTTIDTASAYVSSTAVNSEQTLHPSAGNRGMLPLHHSTPLIVHKQPSPPLPRSPPATVVMQSAPPLPPPPTTPPPAPIVSIQRSKTPHENEPTKVPSNPSKSAYRLPILTRDDYYMKPTMVELKALFDDHGQCIVEQFTVGREKFGSVTFYGRINVAGLNLDQIIEIDRHEVTVYPDDKNKPPVGQELNGPARITLLGVYPIDRSTREEITDEKRIAAMNYSDYLKEVTKKFDGDFIAYGPRDGSWTFTVKHFTRYGLDGSEDDFVVVKKPVGKQQQPQQPVPPKTVPVNSTFLDQTIALNDTFSLSPKAQQRFSSEQSIDMEEKENTSNVRPGSNSLIGLQPDMIEQLAQSMFDDDEDDELNGFIQLDDRMITSTKIIPGHHPLRPIPPTIREPLIEKSASTTIVDGASDTTRLAFNLPSKPIRERVHSRLPKNIAAIRGQYFRTNFSHQLLYASVDSLNEKRLLLQTPIPSETFSVDELENLFNIYSSACVQQVETNSDNLVPQFRVRQTPLVVNRFIEFYTRILDEKHNDENHSFNSLTEYTLQVLALCRLLWGPIELPANVQLINRTYFEEQKRRHLLSKWLHQCILSQPKQQQQWIMQNSELLSRGLLNDCVKFAHEEGELRLSALIHAASGSNNVRDVLRHCTHEDIFDVYTKDFQKTIAILSGEFIVKDQNLVDPTRQKISWEMALALHLWFANASSDSISTIVSDLETACHEHYWLKPIAHYAQKNSKTIKSLDLRWQLLKLYTDDTYPVESVFDVYAYTSNAFDYRLCWLLYITLQSVGGYPLSTENDTRLHVDFAQQLENLGLWKLAIFVLLHINEPTNRTKMVTEYLHQHVISNVDLTQDEQFLVDEYNIPLNLILSTKAMRAEYDYQWTSAVRLWIDAREWRRAHDTYCSQVFHDTLLRGDYEFARQTLDALDHQRATIAHWNRRGGFVKQYVELLILCEKIDQGQISLSNRVHHNVISYVHRLCDHLSDVVADQYFKKISLVDIGRRLLSILNYAVTCSHLTDLNIDNDENVARKMDIFRQTFTVSVPCSLPIELLMEQIEQRHYTSSRSLRH